jgi:hypothetical protein
MRSPEVPGHLIYCADYRCGHSIAISANQMRASELQLEPVQQDVTPVK